MGGDSRDDRQSQPAAGASTMKLSDAPWRSREGMAQLLEALGAGEAQTRYVGGAVRDTILGLPVSDIDLATRLQPLEVIERLERRGIKAVPTGIAHGTVTAVLRDGPVEVTTLRRDVATDGRRATVAFTDDWREDAARRDFTFNALSADPYSGEIHDYFGGVADLAARRVRFIGDPLTRIAEDHLRILRFFRFQARFGSGEADAEALAACTARANDLMALSRERIADELLKLLALPDPVAAAALMVERGILRPVLPEIEPGGVETLRLVVEREAELGFAPAALRRLAALLPADTDVASSIASRLRLSTKAAKRLAAAAARDAGDGEHPRRLAYRMGVEGAIDRLLAGSSWRKAADLRDWHKPSFPLSGGDLIAMGLKPGPLVAKTLWAIEEEWMRADFTADEEGVRRIARDQVTRALHDSQ
jgi:poly(A) polymerase